MSLRNFHAEGLERDDPKTLPNALTVTRAVGGFALGVALGLNEIDAQTAAIIAGVLAATDAEGSLISATDKYPSLQEKLRIWPSDWGRKGDPTADKVFAISVFLGGIAGGFIPKQYGAGVVAAEVATMAASGIARLRGNEPEVSKVGKAGMVARCIAISSFLISAAAEKTEAADVFMKIGEYSAVAAIGLGLASATIIAKNYWKKRNDKKQQLKTGADERT